MQEVGKYLLPGVNIYQGKFANIEQCILKSDKKTPYAFKLMLGNSENAELMLDRFINHLKKQKGVYKVRSFPDEYGKRNQKILIDHLLPGQGGVVFVLPLATEPLRKTLLKRYQYYHSEFDSITVLTQIMMSYRTFYSLQIPYRILNPGNVLRYNGDYVLTPPSTLFSQPEVLNPDSTLNNYDYLYTAPEILKKHSIDLFGKNEETKDGQNTEEDFYIQDNEIITSPNYIARFEAIVHKQDIWGMGVIFYRLLFGEFPFQHADSKNVNQAKESFLKPNWSNKKKYEESTFRWYWYYRHIMNNELMFPEKILVHKSIIDLLRKMLEKDPIKRISYLDMKKHDFVNYYMIMHRTKTKGIAYSINNISFKESRILTEKNARKEFKIELKNKLKKEIEKNKLRRKTLYEKHRKAELERKRKRANTVQPGTQTGGGFPAKPNTPAKSSLFGEDPKKYREKNQIKATNDYDIDRPPQTFTPQPSPGRQACVEFETGFESNLLSKIENAAESVRVGSERVQPARLQHRQRQTDSAPKDVFAVGQTTQNDKSVLAKKAELASESSHQGLHKKAE